MQDSSQSSLYTSQDRKQITGSFAKAKKVLNLPFKESISRAGRDNAIDVYIGDEYMDVLADGNWKRHSQRNLQFSQRKRREHGWIQMTDVTLGSDAFFPFSDNIERAYKKWREI